MFTFGSTLLKQVFAGIHQELRSCAVNRKYTHIAGM